MCYVTENSRVCVMIVVVADCVVVIDVHVVRGHRSRLYGMIEIWEHNRATRSVRTGFLPKIVLLYILSTCNFV